jgi:hypothetical protein
LHKSYEEKLTLSRLARERFEAWGYEKLSLKTTDRNAGLGEELIG